MPYYIRLELKSDLEFLQKIINKAALKVKNNDVSMVDISEEVTRLHDALHSVLTLEDINQLLKQERNEKKLQKEANKGTKKSTASSSKVQGPILCNNHKTYTAVRRPRTDCSNCWEAYKKFHPLEYPKVRAAFERIQRTKGQ